MSFFRTLRQMEQNNDECRLVGLSATLPNYQVRKYVVFEYCSMQATIQNVTFS